MGRSYTDIKYDLRYNLEKYGVLPGSLAVATKAMPGSKIFSYTPQPVVGANNGADFSVNQFNFNGTSDYIDFGYISISGAYTLISESAIVNNANSNRLINFYDAVSGKRGMFEINPGLGQIYTAYDNSHFARWDGAISTEHVVYSSVHDGVTGQKLYISGIDQGAPDGTGAPSNDTVSKLILGAAPRSPLVRFFEGSTKSAFLFSTDLSDQQIYKISNSDVFAPRPDISYFDMASSPILSIGSISQGQTVDNVSLVQHHSLSIDPINQGQTIESPDLVQANVLVLSGVDQGQTLEQITLSTGNTLTVPGNTQAQTLDGISLVQQNTLGIDQTDQAQAVDNIILSAGVVLQIADMIQAQDIDIINLIPHYALAVDQIAQGQSLDNISIESGIILGIAEIIQSQVIDNIDLTQAGNLIIDSIAQGQIIDNVVFAQVDGKITISLTIKSPGAIMGIKSPGINLEAE